jgi:hypothetical protein
MDPKTELMHLAGWKEGDKIHKLWHCFPAKDTDGQQRIRKHWEQLCRVIYIKVM